MAKPAFSKEQLNFFKFSTLVVHEFPNVLRQIFVRMWDSKVAISPGFIIWDDSIRARNLLLTFEGGKTDIPTTKSIKEWDCTALFKATIYAKTFSVPSSKGSTLNDLYLKKSKPAPGSFHPSVKSSNQNETYALAIDQLRLLRNTLCHLSKLEIVKSDFDSYVQLAKDALTAMKLDTAFVDVIGQMSESDFPTGKIEELKEGRVKELQAISMFHENLEQKLSSIEENTVDIHKLTEEIQKSTEEIQKSTDKIDDIHTVVKNISLEKKENVPGEHDNRRNEERQTTQSCLPEKQPMFTAREAEIEKVVSYLKDEGKAIVSIHGGPGYGKTAIAVEVSHKLSNDHKIPVFFSDLSRAITEDEMIREMCRDVGLNHDEDPKSSLIIWLKNIKDKVIFVLDDIDNLLLEKIDFYDFVCLLRKNSNQRCQIVTTSRTSYEIPNLSNSEVQVNEMDNEACVELLRKKCPKQDLDHDFLLKLAKRCGNIPLAMCIAASRVDDFKDSDELLRNLNERPMETLENLRSDQYVYRAINMSYKKLDAEQKETFVRLAIFEGNFHQEAAREVIEKDDLDTTRILKNLVSRSLIKQPTMHRYSIHLLIKHYLNIQAETEDKREVKSRAEVLMVRYYLKLGNDLTIKSYSKDGYKVNREALKKEAHNIQNVLRICYQQKNSNSEISKILVGSEIYTTSSRYFSLFVRTIIPGSTVDEFLQRCAKLAEESEQHGIKITFDCLLADEERRKSINKPDELFNNQMDAIMEEFAMHYEDVGEDKSICAHYYYQYGQYLLRKSEGKKGKKRLDLLNHARDQFKKSSALRLELNNTSVGEADTVFSLLQLGNVWKKIAATKRSPKERDEESTEAQKCFEEAISFSESSLGEHALTSACYKNLGDQLLTTENFKEAEKKYDIAKKMREDLGLDACKSHVFLLNNIGQCLTSTNRAEEAIEILESARDMAEKLPKSESSDSCTGKVYTSLAFACDFLQSENAVEYAKKALSLNKRMNYDIKNKLEKIIKT